MLSGCGTGISPKGICSLSHIFLTQHTSLALIQTTRSITAQNTHGPLQIISGIQHVSVCSAFTHSPNPPHISLTFAHSHVLSSLARTPCMHSQSRTLSHTPHAFTHTQAFTHTRIHTHTHSHTHIVRVGRVGGQGLREEVQQHMAQ